MINRFISHTLFIVMLCASKMVSAANFSPGAGMDFSPGAGMDLGAIPALVGASSDCTQCHAVASSDRTSPRRSATEPITSTYVSNSESLICNSESLPRNPVEGINATPPFEVGW